MKSLLTLLLFLLINSAFGQTQPYGKIDTADLRLTECGFEKEAGAMVLFDRGDIFCRQYTTELIYHRRIKIFNEKGKEQASVRIEYISKNSLEDITDINAQTINLDGSTITYTPLDKKQIIREKVDNYRKAVILNFPNVRPGSVIELKYKWATKYSSHYPKWFFQYDIPVRYSLLVANLSSGLSVFNKVKQDFAIKKTEQIIGRYPMVVRRTWALANVHSYVDEPYMSEADGTIQRIGFYKPDYETWPNTALKVRAFEDFGMQMNPDFVTADTLLAHVTTLPGAERKAEYLFNHVKANMAWNNNDNWATETGVKKAWLNKTGNSTEVNLVLYLLLHKAGVKCWPVLVSTPDNGGIEPDMPGAFQFNRTVVYLPLTDSTYSILDATGKENVYNQIPYDLLNTYGLAINPNNVNAIRTGKENGGLLFSIRSFEPVYEMVNINANIKTDGKMHGEVMIQDYSYNKTAAVMRSELMEKKYTDYLADDNNNIKIHELKFEDSEVDTLPLVQKFNFENDLNQADDGYLYFNTNLFSGLRNNPFISENRYSSIQFSYPTLTIVSGVYTIPDNYKLESIPKTVNIKTEDGFLSIRRIMGHEDNRVMVRFIVERKRNLYDKEEYPGLREFYRKMFDILNEQVVLKKT